MKISVKRVFEDPAPGDGYRVLVDRLWPRGVSKDRASLDRWDKDVAPSAELRKKYHANPDDWAEFQRAYVQELRDRDMAVRALLADAKSSGRKAMTLLYASRNQTRNHAIVLREYLSTLETQ